MVRKSWQTRALLYPCSRSLELPLLHIMASHMCRAAGHGAGAEQWLGVASLVWVSLEGKWEFCTEGSLRPPLTPGLYRSEVVPFHWLAVKSTMPTSCLVNLVRATHFPFLNLPQTEGEMKVALFLVWEVSFCKEPLFLANDPWSWFWF